MPDRLDPRAPLVLDTRELGRRPGSMRRVSWTAPAPGDVGNAVLSVPAGADVDIDLRLEAVMDGVLVTGTARTSARGDCVRCLEPVEYDVEVDLQELYAYDGVPAGHSAGRGLRAAGREERDLDEADTSTLEGDLLDLEPVLRDTLVLALPLQPRCDDDCPGLCAECGARLAEDPDHGHEVIDARWSALAALARPDAPGDALADAPSGTLADAPAHRDLTSRPDRRTERFSLN